MPAPRIAVIIPHLNDAERLALCLADLAAQSFDMGQAEIVVVDNGSKVLPRAAVAAHPGVRLAEEKTPGPGPARNRGASLTVAPLLAFTDSDCRPAPDWVAAIVARFEAEPGLAVLGGEIEITVTDPQAPSRAEAFELLYGFRQRMQIRRHRFSASANLAMRRSVFEAVGPFGGLEVSEDLDWGQRADAMGYATRYAPEALVRHPARADMDGLYRQWSRHVSHFYEGVRGTRRGRAKFAALAAAMALSPLAEIPTVLRSDKLQGAGQRARAFRGLVDVRLFRAGEMIRALRAGGWDGNTRWNRG